MASQKYPLGVEHLIEGDLDFDADDIRLLFYAGTFNSAHEFVADLTGASIIARGGALTGKTTALGVFDANNFTITSVSGSAFAHVVLYQWTGSDATSILFAFYDISTFTPNGGDVNVVLNASGLFAI